MFPDFYRNTIFKNIYRIRVSSPLSFITKKIMFQNQVYPSASRYQKLSPAQQHQMSQYNASGRKMAPVHRPMSGPKISMRDLNLGKRT